jgi:hypothetical protein
MQICITYLTLLFHPSRNLISRLWEAFALVEAAALFDVNVHRIPLAGNLFNEAGLRKWSKGTVEMIRMPIGGVDDRELSKMLDQSCWDLWQRWLQFSTNPLLYIKDLLLWQTHLIKSSISIGICIICQDIHIQFPLGYNIPSFPNQNSQQVLANRNNTPTYLSAPPIWAREIIHAVFGWIKRVLRGKGFECERRTRTVPYIGTNFVCSSWDGSGVSWRPGLGWTDTVNLRRVYVLVFVVVNDVSRCQSTVKDVEAGGKGPWEDLIEGNEWGLNGFREGFSGPQRDMCIHSRRHCASKSIGRHFEGLESLRQDMS